MTPKKSKSEPENKEQFSRFIEAAKNIDTPEAKENFEEALAKIAKKKRPIQPSVLKDES